MRDPGELCFLAPFASHPLANGAEAADLISSDCDGDGKPDLIAAMRNGNVVGLHNDGSGAQFDVTQADVSNGQAAALWAGQLDGEPAVDIVVSYDDKGPVQRDYWVNGFALDPSCSPTVAATMVLSGRDVAAGGVNEGAQPRFLAWTTDNNGEGRVQCMAFDQDELPAWNGIISMPVGTDLLGIATGDLDGDGDDDLAAASPSQGSIWLVPFKVVETPQGSEFEYDLGVPAVAIPNGPRDLAIGDLDGDARPELISANDDGSVVVLHNDGELGFTVRAVAPITSEGSASSARRIVLADMDGDGDLDVVSAGARTSNDTGFVSVLLNDGSGVLALALERDFPLVVGDSPLEVGLRPASVVVADFDGDGALDLATASAVVASDTASVSVLLQSP